jgi:hypothetical protein
MSDGWEEATYAGKAVAQRRRLAGLTPEQRLAWLEDALIDAERIGVLTKARQHKQRDLINRWERDSRVR